MFVDDDSIRAGCSSLSISRNTNCRRSAPRESSARLPGVYETTSHWEIATSYLASAAQGTEATRRPPEGIQLLDIEGMPSAGILVSASEAQRGPSMPSNCATVKVCSRALSALDPGAASADSKAPWLSRYPTESRRRSCCAPTELAPVMYGEADKWRIDCQQIVSEPSGRASTHGTLRDLISRDLWRGPSRCRNRRITIEVSAQGPRVALERGGYVERSQD